MSKITNDGLTRSDTGCFRAVPNTHMATVGVKGLIWRQHHTLYSYWSDYRYRSAWSWAELQVPWRNTLYLEYQSHGCNHVLINWGQN